jgi:hypothetical protein
VGAGSSSVRRSREPVAALWALPHAVVPALQRHLDEYAGEEPDSFVFTGPTGATIWRGNFNKLVGWKAATTKIGYPNLHFHDLRAIRWRRGRERVCVTS